MDEAVSDALRRDRTIDITTIGRRSLVPQRTEIWFHNLDGSIYITGTPGTRDWYANLLSDPRFTFHLKESVRADLDAVAAPVTDEVERRRILGVITDRLDATDPLEEWVAASPLVEVTFADRDAPTSGGR